MTTDQTRQETDMTLARLTALLAPYTATAPTTPTPAPTPRHRADTPADRLAAQRRFDTVGLPRGLRSLLPGRSLPGCTP